MHILHISDETSELLDFPPFLITVFEALQILRVSEGATEHLLLLTAHFGISEYK